MVAMHLSKFELYTAVQRAVLGYSTLGLSSAFRDQCKYTNSSYLFHFVICTDSLWEAVLGYSNWGYKTFCVYAPAVH